MQSHFVQQRGLIISSHVGICSLQRIIMQSLLKDGLKKEKEQRENTGLKM